MKTLNRWGKPRYGHHQMQSVLVNSFCQRFPMQIFLAFFFLAFTFIYRGQSDRVEGEDSMQQGAAGWNPAGPATGMLP